MIRGTDRTCKHFGNITRRIASCAGRISRPPQGIDAHEQEAIAFFEMFPDQHLVNNPYKIMLAEGGWTCTVADFKGTMTGPMSMPDGTVVQPTNKSFHSRFLYGCALERARSNRGRESFLRSHGDAEANRRDAGPSAKSGVTASDPTMAERIPALFIGHANPTNALLVNPVQRK